MGAESIMDIIDVSLRWLEAREAFHEGGSEYAESYCQADEQLLAAFSADWTLSDPSMFAVAYQSFRHTLIRQAVQRQPIVIALNLKDRVLS